MQPLKQRWKAIPTSLRKPLVLVIGLLIVIAAPFAGALPGPGGIPLFLIGIAILASEFEWAQRIRDPIISRVEAAGRLWRAHKVLWTLAIVVIASLLAMLSYYLFRYLQA